LELFEQEHIFFANNVDRNEEHYPEFPDNIVNNEMKHRSAKHNTIEESWIEGFEYVLHIEFALESNAQDIDDQTGIDKNEGVKVQDRLEAQKHKK
jgi:hypothetical protein